MKDKGMTKQSSIEWTAPAFWQGFFKEAAIKIPKLPKIPTIPGGGSFVQKDLPLGVTRMSDHAKAAIKPMKSTTAPAPLDYSKINKIEQKPSSTLSYGAGGSVSYTPPKA